MSVSSFLARRLAWLHLIAGLEAAAASIACGALLGLTPPDPETHTLFFTAFLSLSLGLTAFALAIGWALSAKRRVLMDESVAMSTVLAALLVPWISGVMALAFTPAMWTPFRVHTPSGMAWAFACILLPAGATLAWISVGVALEAAVNSSRCRSVGATEGESLKSDL
jgi:hypothetical protein